MRLLSRSTGTTNKLHSEFPLEVFSVLSRCSGEDGEKKVSAGGRCGAVPAVGGATNVSWRAGVGEEAQGEITTHIGVDGLHDGF